MSNISKEITLARITEKALSMTDEEFEMLISFIDRLENSPEPIEQGVEKHV